MNPTKPLIDVTNINEKVYNFLKKGIISLQYPPGQKLNIKELQAILGVSPTPIKDAIFRLAGEGFVEVNSRQGTFVKSITQKGIVELLQMRMILETGALDLTSGKITDGQLKTLRKRYQEMANLTAGRKYDYPDYMQKDHLFHLEIVALPGNERLLDAYDRMNSHMQVVRFQHARKIGKVLPWADQDHLEIISSLERREIDQAKEYIRKHISKSTDAFIDDWGIEDSSDALQ